MVAADRPGFICRSGDLISGGRGVRFAVRRHGEVVPAFVIRFEGMVHAYLNRCSHRSLELDWIEGEIFDAFGRHLLCATHGARYAPASGACVDGATPFRGEAPSKGVAGPPQETKFIESPGRHRRKSYRLGRWRPLHGAGLVKLAVVEQDGAVRLAPADDVHLAESDAVT